MRMETSRRGFLRGAAGAVGVGLSAGAAGAAVDNEALGFKLGVASYSLREFQRGLALKMIRQLQTPYVSVKEFHLWISAPRTEWEKGRKDFEKAGLKIMSGGTISFPTADAEDIRQKFEYAKTTGIPMMVCAPTAESLPVVEKFVKEYNIAIAIHNHGPEDKHFPTPQSVLKAVKNMDPRCGLCIDLGHTTRTGADPVASLAEAGNRLLDVHIKDLRNLMDKNSQCDVGDGAMPVVAIFKQLQKMGYKGCVNLEYEIHGDDPLPGMQKSFSYMRGVLAGLKG
ncbi:MAG TPA: sugar phosphate isomerase/epimerase [Bryobacteraceae bacterium]|nr:sugar phosphate isomerase/epimerase [Bryobacteraceae bacterium]